MKQIILLLLTISISGFADDIYLTNGVLYRNVKIISRTDSVVVYLYQNFERMIGTPFVQSIVPTPYDSTVVSSTQIFSEELQREAFNDALKQSRADVVPDYSGIKNKSLNISASEERTKKKDDVASDNSNLVMIQTVKGETITGEFISATDTSATYKISSGLLTLMKSHIISVNKSNSNFTLSVSSGADLSPEKAKQYNQKRLSIELEGVGTSSFTSLTKYNMVGMYTDWKKWTAFQGFNKITEESFFRLTGYERESGLAANFHKSAGQSTTWGVLSSLTGAVVLYLAYTNKETMKIGNSSIEYVSVNTTGAIIGYCLTTLGGILIVAGVTQENKNYAPYSLVQSIADEYNKKLVLSVRKQL
jgi:hypothetical protein